MQIPLVVEASHCVRFSSSNLASYHDVTFNYRYVCKTFAVAVTASSGGDISLIYVNIRVAET